MVTTIFQSNFMLYLFLPFLLIFVLVYAVLEKSKILGNDQHRINAMISLAVALILISATRAVTLILDLVPFMAIGLVVILVFMVLVGAIFKPGEFDLGKNVTKTLMAIIAVAVVIAVAVFSGAWDYVAKLVKTDSNIVGTVIMAVVAIGVVIAVLVGGKPAAEKKSP